MRLHSDWKGILQRAWSIRVMALAAFLSGCEAVVNAFDLEILGIKPWVKALILFLVIGGAFIARILAQNDDQK